MRWISVFALAALSAGVSFGQACDPLATLGIGSTWSFTSHQGDYLPTGQGMIGSFQILPGNRLTVTATINDGSVITRRAQASGRYLVYDDCTGGELMFMINALPVQFEFVYVNGFAEMTMVADYLDPRNSAALALHGRARRTPLACPPGVTNPLTLLAGMAWSFETNGAYFFGVGSASVGIFNATINGAGLGVFTGVETINNSLLGLTRRASITGRFQVYPDCTGGEILIMNRDGAATHLQLEFVFAGPNFDTLYLLNDETSVGGLQQVVGVARKF